MSIDFSQMITAEDKAQQSAQAARDAWKAARAEAVRGIVVEVDGLRFDGDETSQTRMARSVSVMDPGETIPWVLSDNTPALVSRDQLREALRLAGKRQTELWVAADE